MSQLFSIIDEYIINHKLSKVSKVVLTIGEMTCVEDSTLEYTFRLFARGTKVEDAELIIKKIEAVSECQYCGERYKINYTDKICPTCKKYNNNLISGDELLLARLEGEESNSEGIEK